MAEEKIEQYDEGDKSGFLYSVVTILCIFLLTAVVVILLFAASWKSAKAAALGAAASQIIFWLSAHKLALAILAVAMVFFLIAYKDIKGDREDARKNEKAKAAEAELMAAAEHLKNHK